MIILFMQREIKPLMSSIKNYLHQLQQQEQEMPTVQLSAAESLLLFGALETVFKSDTKTINYRKRLENLHDKLYVASRSSYPVKIFNIHNQ
tara:strand:- start:242 stop:514 length:273 start_codon:yes stop_codon:yes gene_type:complete